MKVQLAVEAPADVERVLSAFGAKLGLEGPATPEQVGADLGRYVQDTVRGQEQTAAVQIANALPPVDVEPEKAP